MSRGYRKSCGGKRRFPDHQAAVRALHRINGPGARHQGRNGKKPSRSYYCARCNGHHLTKDRG